MRFVPFVGLRFLKPRRGKLFLSIITLVAISGITVGVAVLTIVISVLTGFQEDIRDKILGAYSHILVLSFDPTFANYRAVEEKVKAQKGVVAVSPFVYSEAMLTTPDSVSGVILRGVDPKTVGKVTSLADSMVEGSLDALKPPTEMEAGELPAIIIGKELAFIVHAFVGDEVRIVLPFGEETPAGMVPKVWRFRVAGIFDSGMYEFDAKFVFIHLAWAQRMFGLGDAVTGLEVKVDDVMRAREVARALQKELGYPYRVRDWMEMNRNLFSALKLEKLVVFIVLTLIIFVAALNIFSVLYMVVQDKKRSIAILRAMGASARDVLRIFMIQGLIIGLVGAVLGFVLGFGGVWIQHEYGVVKHDPQVYNIEHVPVKIMPLDVFFITVAAIGLSLVATYFPARLAARTDPVEVLRYEG